MPASVMISRRHHDSHSRDFPTRNPIVSPPANRLPPTVKIFEEMATEEDIENSLQRKR